MESKKGTIYVTRDVIWLQRMYFAPNLDQVEIPIVPIGDVDLTNAPIANVASREGEIDDNAANVADNVANVARKVQFESAEVEIKFEDDASDESSLFPESDSESEEEEDEDERNEDRIRIGSTRSGRAFRETGGFSADERTPHGPSGMTPAEKKFYARMRELNELSLLVQDPVDAAIASSAADARAEETGFVGAALGGGFGHTSELRVMKYNEAMNTPDAPHWRDAIEEEYSKMTMYNVSSTIF